MKKLNKLLSVMMIALIISSSLQSLVLASDIKFKDIKSTDWYAETIASLVSKGIIDGYPNGTFKPNGPVTTAEFLKLSLGAAQVNFDNTTSPWHKDLMQKALDLGIIDNTLYNSPNEPIKRKDVAMVLTKLIDKTPTLKDEFVPISIEEIDKDMVMQLNPKHFDKAYYWNPTTKQLRKVVVTYGNGKTKEILNWNKGGVGERIWGTEKNELKEGKYHDEMYSIYYKQHPLDYTRFQHMIDDLAGLKSEEKTAIYKLFDYGMIIGNIDNTWNVKFMPNSNLTRAEVSTIIERLIEPSKRMVLDEINTPRLMDLNPDSGVPVRYDEVLKNGGVLRSNQYKSIQRVRELINSDIFDSSSILRFAQNSRETYWFELVFEYPTIPIDDYSHHPSVEMGESSMNRVKFYVPKNQRAEFEKDFNLYYKEKINNKRFAVNKTYGEARVEYRSGTDADSIKVMVFPTEQSFKFFIEEENRAIKRNIDRYTSKSLDNLEEGYYKEMMKAILKDVNISFEELFKIAIKHWNNKYYW